MNCQYLPPTWKHFIHFDIFDSSLVRRFCKNRIEFSWITPIQLFDWHDILTRKSFLNYSFIEEESYNCTANCSSSESSTPIQEVPLNYIKIIVLSVIILLTFLGNVAIIFAIAARRSKLTRMYYFILQLSIADLLTAFLTLLPEVIWTFTLPHFYGGVVMCKIIKFTQMLGPYLSSYILIMTAVDRYQAICNPLGNCTWTPKRSQVRPNYP